MAEVGSPKGQCISFFFVDIIDQNMIDCQKILEIADRELAGTDLFTVSCKCSPMNEVELSIDSDTHVTIERCGSLSGAGM